MHTDSCTSVELTDFSHFFFFSETPMTTHPTYPSTCTASILLHNFWGKAPRHRKAACLLPGWREESKHFYPKGVRRFNIRTGWNMPAWSSAPPRRPPHTSPDLSGSVLFSLPKAFAQFCPGHFLATEKTSNSKAIVLRRPAAWWADAHAADPWSAEISLWSQFSHLPSHLTLGLPDLRATGWENKKPN